jgi:SH3-like domain-containing protein
MALVDGDDEDAGISRAVAVGRGAVLRAAPSDRARIVSQLASDLLTLPADDQGEGAWVRVATADGRRGWVRRALIRGFGDYRAVFERRGGRWRMIAFVAGD